MVTKITYKGLSLANMVKDNKVKFEFFKINENGDGELWYSLNVNEDNFKFPVPTKGAGSGIFLASDKAMLFLTYIRKEVVRINALVAEEKTNEKNYA